MKHLMAPALVSLLMACSAPFVPEDAGPPVQSAVSWDEVETAADLEHARILASARAWEIVDRPDARAYQVRVTDRSGTGPYVTNPNTNRVTTFSQDGASSGSPVLTVQEGQTFRIRFTKPPLADWPRNGMLRFRVKDSAGYGTDHIYAKFGKNRDSVVWAHCGTSLTGVQDGNSCLLIADDPSKEPEDRTLTFQPLDKVRVEENRNKNAFEFKVNTRHKSLTYSPSGSNFETFDSGAVLFVKTWAPSADVIYQVRVEWSRSLEGDDDWFTVDWLLIHHTSTVGNSPMFDTFGSCPEIDADVAATCKYYLPWRNSDPNHPPPGQSVLSPRTQRVRFTVTSPDFAGVHGVDPQPSLTVRVAL